MVRFWLFALLVLPLWASDIEWTLRALLDRETFDKNRSFIVGGLFRNPQLYYDEYGVDYPKILTKLKENGLLKLTTQSPRAFRIHIHANDAPIFVTRSVQNALKALGYYYATPVQAEFVDGGYRLVMLMNAESALDPVSFISEIQKYGYRVNEIVRENDTSWRYVIALQYPKLPEAIPLEYDIEVSKGNLQGEYWYAVNRQGGILQFAPIDGGAISPKVALYDASLRLIGLQSLQKSGGVYQLKLDTDVVFVRLSDEHSPAAIKTGIRTVLQQ
ncbi:MAG: hypothetical protein K2N20_02775 [Helicobacter sp.]|nr:hypothetical protein [Helicobacter sp.]